MENTINGEILFMNLGMNAVLLLTDRDIQKWLRQVSNDDLVIALKGTSADVRGKVFSNVSEQTAVHLKKYSTLLRPVRTFCLWDATESASQKYLPRILKTGG